MAAYDALAEQAHADAREAQRRMQQELDQVLLSRKLCIKRLWHARTGVVSCHATVGMSTCCSEAQTNERCAAAAGT